MKIKRIRRVEVNLVGLDGQRSRFLIKAGPGRLFTPEGVADILDQHASNVEKVLPGREFRLVPLAGGAKFNFIEIAKETAECAIQS